MVICGGQRIFTLGAGLPLGSDGGSHDRAIDAGNDQFFAEEFFLKSFAPRIVGADHQGTSDQRSVGLLLQIGPSAIARLENLSGEGFAIFAEHLGGVLVPAARGSLDLANVVHIPSLAGSNPNWGPALFFQSPRWVGEPGTERTRPGALRPPRPRWLPAAGRAHRAERPSA